MRGLMLLAYAAALALLERKRPLRPRREPDGVHLARNVAIFATTVAAVSVVQPRLLAPLVARVKRQRLGLLQQVNLPEPLRLAAGVLLLDYTLWWWHWMNHRVPLLWRFHLVHHADRDLDVSTGIRFHFGEMTLSFLYRALQVRLLGTDARTLAAWNTLLMPSILFHHSNLRLPARADRALTRLIVTPRMHGVHHSVIEEETNSNWASLFTWWDSLHGTLRLRDDGAEVVTGVPAYDDPEEVTVGKALAMPFRRRRDDWRRR
jgi:sterol desaturase/sphingolipid hydroxylase (fatty acid hydroxylase superfamily)